jgi:hypothetical protein
MVAPVQPISSRMISHHSSTSFPMSEKKEENRETDLKNKRELLSLWEVISLFLLFHGRVELAHIGGYARAPTKSHELGVYGRGRVSYLSCARGSCISCSSGGIRHGIRCILRARIWCAFTSISFLAATVL